MALAIALLGSQGCKGILDEIPVSQVGSEYLKTPAGFEASVKGVYSSLRSYYGTEEAMTLSIFGTDTYTMGADGANKFVNQYTSQIDSRLSVTNSIWNSFYPAINTANLVIDAAPAVTGMDAALIKRRVAEVKFLRAHHYFILVQMFGPVSLLTTGNLESQKDFSRAPVKDIYTQIIADLETALPDLSLASAEYGRVSKAATEHLLARVYLTRATSEAKEADDYTKAARYAKNVIENYSYSLLPDFASVFAQGAGEVSNEVIFATQYTSDPLTNGVGNRAHLFFGMEYDVQAGMQRDIENGRPFKRFMPTTYMLETVFAQADRVNDSRYKKTFKDTWLCNRPGKYTNMFDTSKKELTFASGDTTIFIPGYEMSLEERAKRPYQVLTPSLYKQNLYPTLRKFFDNLRPDVTYEAGSRDFLMFRLAETHLIAAEALVKLNKPQEAAEHINVVRRRAAWPGKEKAMEITAAKATMDFIMEERERELAGEMFRWFDLKRWGNLVERVKLYNPDGAANIKEYHNLRPIPQDQIDRTEGGAQSYPQNPGY